MKNQSRARGWALQALYAWEQRGGGVDRGMPVLQELFANLRVSPTNRPYAEILVRLVGTNLGTIDRTIEASLTNWRLERLAVVDRAILRLGTAEMMFVDDVPPRMCIREMVQLAESGRFDAVIALGCVIRGATPHFEYVAGAAANGVAAVGASVDIPVVFGVLTTETIEQAIERAGTKAGNKGWDAAMVAMEMSDLYARLGGREAR